MWRGHRTVEAGRPAETVGEQDAGVEREPTPSIASGRVKAAESQVPLGPLTSCAASERLGNLLGLQFLYL